MQPQTLAQVLASVDFAPAKSLLLGVVAAGLVFIIASACGMMVLNIVRQIFGVGRSAREETYKHAGCKTKSCNESLKFFKENQRRDAKYYEEDSRRNYERHRKENLRFGIRI